MLHYKYMLRNYLYQDQNHEYLRSYEVIVSCFLTISTLESIWSLKNSIMSTVDNTFSYCVFGPSWWEGSGYWLLIIWNSVWSPSSPFVPPYHRSLQTNYKSLTQSFPYGWWKQHCLQFTISGKTQYFDTEQILNSAFPKGNPGNLTLRLKDDKDCMHKMAMDINLWKELVLLQKNTIYQRNIWYMHASHMPPSPSSSQYSIIKSRST